MNSLTMTKLNSISASAAGRPIRDWVQPWPDPYSRRALPTEECLVVLRGADLPKGWTVQIDAEGAPTDEPVDGKKVEGLIDLLREYAPAVSHRPRRFSTRLTVYAGEAIEAATGAVDIWREAVGEAGLPPWEVVRIDVTRTAGGPQRMSAR
jgi:hypothetical protein